MRLHSSLLTSSEGLYGIILMVGLLVELHCSFFGNVMKRCVSDRCSAIRHCADASSEQSQKKELLPSDPVHHRMRAKKNYGQCRT